MDEVTQALVERFIRVRRHSKDGVRKLHKPLLQLLGLSAFVETGRSEVRFDVARSRFEALLKEYGPPAEKYTLVYPFKFLANDGIWTAHLSDGSAVTDSTKESQLIAAFGSFTGDVEAALKADSALAFFIARAVADHCLPTDLATDLLTELNLIPSTGSLIQFEFAKPGRKRNAQWRGKVISNWGGKCAFCGYDGMLNQVPVALDAAHVRWFNFDGPDELNNGLALCVLDHRLFDRGALGMTSDLHLQVSPAFSYSSAVSKRIHDLHGTQIVLPSGAQRPHGDYIAWHRREVFKAG